MGRLVLEKPAALANIVYFGGKYLESTFFISSEGCLTSTTPLNGFMLGPPIVMGAISPVLPTPNIVGSVIERFPGEGRLFLVPTTPSNKTSVLPLPFGVNTPLFDGSLLAPIEDYGGRILIAFSRFTKEVKSPHIQPKFGSCAPNPCEI